MLDYKEQPMLHLWQVLKEAREDEGLSRQNLGGELKGSSASDAEIPASYIRAIEIEKALPTSNLYESYASLGLDPVLLKRIATMEDIGEADPDIRITELRAKIDVLSQELKSLLETSGGDQYGGKA